MATKTANPGEKIITDNNNLVEIKDTQDKTFKTMSNDSLDLGGGLTLSKTDPKYTSLIGKGFTDEQIIKAISKMDASKIEGVTQKPVETAPKQVETQLQPQTETKPATQEIKAEQTPAKVEKGPQLLPQSDYLDDSEARQQGIIANLNQAIQTNPQSLKDQKSFREYYNYVGRSDLQKKTLDTWYKGYQKGQELAYKDTNDIYKAYDSGNLSSGDLSNLKIVNPAKYNEVNALIDKKNKLATYSQDLYGVTEQANPFQAIIDNYTKGLQTLAISNFYNDYKEAMNSAGIKEQKLAIADKQTELDKIDKQINEKKREVEKRYEGTGATRGKINSIIADETEDLYSMRSNLVIDMNGAISKYNAEAGAIREDFEMKQAEQQYNMQIRQQQMSELGFAMQLMSYETPAQQDERAWNTFIRQQEYTNGNIYSSDPKTRLRAIEKAVDNTLAEFAGIPMVRSRDQMVNDIKNLVEGGMDLGDAITQNIREPIMNKPEYKVWSANKLGISESAMQLAGLNMNWDNNSKSWTLQQGTDTAGLTWSSKQGMRTDRHNNPTAFTTDVAKSAGLVEGVDYVKGDPFQGGGGKTYYTAKLLGDGYDVTMKAMDNYINNKGYLPKWTYADKIGLSAKRWKTASYNDKINMITKMYNQEGGTGVLVPGGSTNVGQVSSQYAPLFKNYNEKGTIPSAANLKSMGMTVEQFTKAASGYQFTSTATQEQKETTQQIYDSLIELENSSGLQSAVGASFQKFLPGWLKPGEGQFIPGSAAANFAAKFDTFRNLQVLPNLALLKGPLSDKDIQFLKSSATSLSLDMSEKDFKDKLAEIKSKLQDKLGISGTGTSGYTFTVPTISGTGNTFTLSNGQSITW